MTPPRQYYSVDIRHEIKNYERSFWKRLALRPDLKASSLDTVPRQKQIILNVRSGEGEEMYVSWSKRCFFYDRVENTTGLSGAKPEITLLSPSNMYTDLCV